MSIAVHDIVHTHAIVETLATSVLVCTLKTFQQKPSYQSESVESLWLRSVCVLKLMWRLLILMLRLLCASGTRIANIVSLERNTPPVVGTKLDKKKTLIFATVRYVIMMQWNEAHPALPIFIN